MHNMGILQSASTLMAACSRRVARASRRLRRDGKPLAEPRLRQDRPQLGALPQPAHQHDPPPRPLLEEEEGGRPGEEGGRGSSTEREEEESSDVEEEEEVEGVLWRKTILMGEKCQPLDFSGVIYYDSKGRRLPGLPPRSPLRSPLPHFSFPVVVASEKMAVTA